MALTMANNSAVGMAVLPDGNGGFTPCPELLTEDELICFLRIPQVSKSEDHRQTVEWLKRMRGLPCIHISRQPLYPLPAIREWMRQQVDMERRK